MTTETDRHATACVFDETVVVGCGGVGLPFAVALAATGSAVLGVDIDPARVAALNAGRTDQVDDGLERVARSGGSARVAICRGDFTERATPRLRGCRADAGR